MLYVGSYYEKLFTRSVANNEWTRSRKLFIIGRVVKLNKTCNESNEYGIGGRERRGK